MKQKISSVTIVYNDLFYIEMMLNGVKDWADEIVIVDGYSTDGTYEFLQAEAKKDPRIKISQHEGANPKTTNFGKARQHAYDMTTSDYVFWIDADEVLQDDARKSLDDAMNKQIDVFDVQYIHFVHDFAHIDSSEPIHIGIVRFHKRYDDVNLDNRKIHALSTSPSFKTRGILFNPIIFHCGYMRGMQKIYEAYIRNVTKGSFHAPFQQAFWKEWWYRGYPTKDFNPDLAPKAIKERFHLGDISHWTNKENKEKNLNLLGDSKLNLSKRKISDKLATPTELADAEELLNKIRDKGGIE